MIIGIGCDVVDHTTTNFLNWPKRPSKIQRIFTEAELALSSDSDETKFLSGRFAAKEAVLKSIGTGIDDNISLRDVEILKDDSGRPKIVIEGDLKRAVEEMKITRWHISISHTESTSTAFVIAECE